MDILMRTEPQTPPPERALGPFGEKLRQQREKRGIALETISTTTKISTRMLRALEEEHFDQLPGGVFNKGFVRAYARQVGLDEEETVGDYLLALRESQVQSQKILPDFRNPALNEGATTPGLAAHNRQNLDKDIQARKVDSSKVNLPKANSPKNDPGRNGLATPVLARSTDVDGPTNISVADRRREDRRKDDRRDGGHDNGSHGAGHINSSSLPAFNDGQFGEIRPDVSNEGSTSIPWGKLAAALFVILAALAFWNLRRQSSGTSASQPASSSTQSTTAPTFQASFPSSQQSSPAKTKTISENAPLMNRPSAVPPAALPKPPSPAPTPPLSTTNASPPVSRAAIHSPAVKPPSTIRVLIRAERTSWVSITADGKPVAHETLIAPAETAVRASREIVVRTGNAAGISFLFDSKTIPAEGNDGEVKTYVFNATGMKVVPESSVAP